MTPTETSIMQTHRTLVAGLLCLLLPACPSSAAAKPPAGRTGSAFVVHADGYLLTCAHCVERAWKIEVKLGAKTYVAAVLASNSQADLALLNNRAAARAYAEGGVAGTTFTSSAASSSFPFPGK